jgi:hypothetical protein
MRKRGFHNWELIDAETQEVIQGGFETAETVKDEIIKRTTVANTTNTFDVPKREEAPVFRRRRGRPRKIQE